MAKKPLPPLDPNMPVQRVRDKSLTVEELKALADELGDET